MKKSIISYFLLVMILVLGLAPIAQAQETSPGVEAVEELDTILARAAAKGFLVTLSRPELASTTSFYLLDSLQGSDLLGRLQNPPVTGFEITESGWISDVSYRVKAVLQPDDREVAIYTGKYDGRWRVESIDLPTDELAGVETIKASGTILLTEEVIPARGNGAGQLVFQTQSGGDIYLINADGTGLRRVTHGIDPQLSFDGTRITFTRWEPRYELFTINTDGTGEQAWVGNWRQMKSPTWLANDERIVFSWQSGGRLEQEQNRVDLEKAAREGEGVDIPSNAVGVEVDGKILRYTIPADAFWSLKLVNLNPVQQADLATERHAYGPSGHPTQPNQFIYRGDNGLALHNLNSQTDQPITSDFRDHTPVISPDGSRIVVSYWQDGHWEVHTMNIDGSNRQRLTETPLTVLAQQRSLTPEVVEGKERFVASENPAWNNAAPTWSPDGSQIAFVTDRTGQWEIWIMNADGSNQRPMFPNGALEGINLNYAGVDERMLSWR